MLHQQNRLKRAQVWPLFTSPKVSSSLSEVTGQNSQDCTSGLGQENLSLYWNKATNKHSSSFLVLPKQHTQYSTVLPLPSLTKLPAELACILGALEWYQAENTQISFQERRRFTGLLGSKKTTMPCHWLLKRAHFTLKIIGDNLAFPMTKLYILQEITSEWDLNYQIFLTLFVT